MDQLRTPWVPAPAKSSSANVAAFLLDNDKNIKQKTYQVDVSTSSSTEEKLLTNCLRKNIREMIPSSSLNFNQSSKTLNVDPKLSRKVQMSPRNPDNSSSYPRKHRHSPHPRHIRRPSSQVKKVKHGHRRSGVSHTLQSKDSLIDVTACLQEKRVEVMKLWEKSLLKGDPSLLSNIENANRLALEAAEEVEVLRRTIQDLQKKEDGLSDSDCVQLEQLRVHVLEKVKKFEEADNLLQENIARQSVSKASLGSVRSKTSQTGDDDQTKTAHALPPGKSESSISTPNLTLPQTQSTSNHQFLDKPHSNNETETHELKELIVLKERPLNFPDESECEADTTKLHYDTVIHSNNRSDKKFTGTSTAVTLENLSRLKLLFEETVNYPPFQQIINSNEMSGRDKGFNNPDMFADQPLRRHSHSNHVRFTEEDQGENLSGNVEAEDLYQDKITTLQRHLMDTEHEVEELKSEIERIESNANFRVRILQNSVQDKFESLQIVPDYLKMFEQKLNETARDKMKLEDDLECKESLMNEIQEENKNLKGLAGELQERLRKEVKSKDFLTFKNTELEKSNTELRKQVDDLNKQIAEMACHIKILKVDEPKKGHKSHSKQDFSGENHKLKIQCAELKEQIYQSKRIVQSLRKSKAKLVANLNERVEELMDALQHSQNQKRIMGEQIRNLKESYHNLFFDDILKPSSSKKSSYAHSSTKFLKSKQRIVKEPKIHSKVTWQTGTSAGMDDL